MKKRVMLIFVTTVAAVAYVGAAAQEPRNTAVVRQAAEGKVHRAKLQVTVVRNGVAVTTTRALPLFSNALMVAAPEAVGGSGADMGAEESDSASGDISLDVDNGSSTTTGSGPAH